MGQKLFPPGTESTRPLTSDNQRTGNIVGAYRFPEMGGFTSAGKVSPKTPFKQVPPGGSTK